MEQIVKLKVRFNTLKYQFDEVKLNVGESDIYDVSLERKISSLEHTIQDLGKDLYPKNSEYFEMTSGFPDSENVIRLNTFLFL